MIISKLSECKQVGFHSNFIATLAKFLVFINATVQLYFKLQLFLLLLHNKIYFPSFITFINYNLFYLKKPNKLNGVDEFAPEIGYTTECFLGSVDGLELRTNGGAELGYPDGKWNVMLYS